VRTTSDHGCAMAGEFLDGGGRVQSAASIEEAVVDLILVLCCSNIF